MKTIKLKRNEKISIPFPTACTLGAFDGLHLGHETLFHQTIEKAKEIKGKSVVISFYPHPDYVLHKRKNQGYLMTFEEKNKRLEEYGIDYHIVLSFDDELAHLSYTSFYEMYLKSFDWLIVGYDFCFGYQKEGTIERLKELHSNVIVVPKVKYQNKEVASKEIRTLLEEGNVEEVAYLLGRRYSITGKVVRGAEIGRTIGYSTANIEKENHIFPKKGVYAVLVLVLGKEYLGFANIGQNPSFNYVSKERLEVHLFHFNKDIYGEEITVSFLKRIRDEQKFSSKEELVHQLEQDEEITMQLYKELIQ